MQTARLVLRSAGFWVSAVLALAGIGGLMAINHINRAGWEFVTGKDLLLAVVTAGILGMTIDTLLKRELVRETSKASIGYLLPEQLKSELEWIYGEKLAWTTVKMTVRLEPLVGQPGLLRMQVFLERELENLGPGAEDAELFLNVDDWGLPPASCITTFNYSVNNGPLLVSDKRSYGPHAVSVPLVKVSLKPGEKCAHFAVFEQTKRWNDVYYEVFSRSIVNPRVIIDIPKGFGHEVNFAHRSQKLSKEGIAPGERTIAATLLPWQHIQVRWWPEGDVNLDQIERKA